MPLILDLFFQLALLSFVAFGGATAVLPELARLVVDNRHWLDATTFNQLFAIAQGAPGPNVLVVTLIGWELAGLAGAVVATLGLCLPMSLVIYLLYGHWERFRGAPWRSAIQTGVAPLAVGLVFSSALLIASTAGAGWRGYALTAVVTVITLRLKNLHPLWLIAAGAALGAAGFV